MSDLDGREKILAKGTRRLLAAMLRRGLPAKLAERRPYGTMRSAWLSAFPKRRDRALTAGDDLETIDLGGEG